MNHPKPSDRKEAGFFPLAPLFTLDLHQTLNGLQSSEKDEERRGTRFTAVLENYIHVNIHAVRRSCRTAGMLISFCAIVANFLFSSHLQLSERSSACCRFQAEGTRGRG